MWNALDNIAHIFLILACKTCYKYNEGHGKKEAFTLGLSEIDVFFFLAWRIFFLSDGILL